MNVASVNMQQTAQSLDMLQNMNQVRGANANLNINSAGEASSVFSTLLNAYMGMATTAGIHEAQAQNLSIDFAIGRHDDMLAVILAQEQAYSSMFFTVQVTSRIIQAYQEIMRMQI